jgi:hypothetical protein
MLSTLTWSAPTPLTSAPRTFAPTTKGKRGGCGLNACVPTRAMAALQGRQLQLPGPGQKQLHGRVVGKQKLSVKSNVRKNGGRHQLGVRRQPRKQQLNVRKNGGRQNLSGKSNVRKNGGRHQLGVTRQPRKQQLNVRKNGGRQQLGVRKNSGRHTLNVRKNAGGKQLRRVKSRCGTWHGVTRTTVATVFATLMV